MAVSRVPDNRPAGEFRWGAFFGRVFMVDLAITIIMTLLGVALFMWLAGLTSFHGFWFIAALLGVVVVGFLSSAFIVFVFTIVIGVFGAVGLTLFARLGQPKEAGDPHTAPQT